MGTPGRGLTGADVVGTAPAARSQARRKRGRRRKEEVRGRVKERKREREGEKERGFGGASGDCQAKLDRVPTFGRERRGEATRRALLQATRRRRVTGGAAAGQEAGGGPVTYCSASPNGWKGTGFCQIFLTVLCWCSRCYLQAVCAINALHWWARFRRSLRPRALPEASQHPWWGMGR